MQQAANKNSIYDGPNASDNVGYSEASVNANTNNNSNDKSVMMLLILKERK